MVQRSTWYPAAAIAGHHVLRASTPCEQRLCHPTALGQLRGRHRNVDRPGSSVSEHEVLIAMSSGARTTEIASQLGISERTVKAHLASIYQKFAVESRTAAIAAARQRDLL